MSKTAEIFVQEFQKLPPLDQQGVLQRLLQRPVRKPSRSTSRVPTVKLGGGRITSQQVAEALDDE
jgi:hypothetical protein